MAKKWRTFIEYYETENGTQISKSLAEREYIITNQRIEIKENEQYYIKIHIKECERNKQLRLF